MQRCGLSDIECQIILHQIERRAKYRKEFLKLRTDPCKHSQEAGYVFDEAQARFIALKAYQYEHFKATPRTALQGVFIILPMFIYGYLINKQRTQFDQDCRCGKIRYKDRIKKLI